MIDNQSFKDELDLLKEAKDKAEELHKLKSKFLAKMTHEIRTPLNVIMSSSLVIRDEVEDKINKDLKDYFELIDTAGNKLIRTIDSILSISELQTGAYKPAMNDFDIYNDVLKILYRQFKVDADSKNLEFNLHKNTRNTSLLGDEYCAFQTLTNLIDNAIKYTQVGKIDIEIMRDNNSKLNVIVSDTGSGISNDLLPHLFEVFSEDDQEYIRKSEGSGLGLSLVKEYCKINNAEIKFENKKEGGTTFTIIFNS